MYKIEILYTSEIPSNYTQEIEVVDTLELAELNLLKKLENWAIKLKYISLDFVYNLKPIYENKELIEVMKKLIDKQITYLNGLNNKSTSGEIDRTFKAEIIEIN